MVVHLQVLTKSKMRRTLCIETAPSFTNGAVWSVEFKREHPSMGDDEPLTITSSNVHEMVLKDCRIKLREIAKNVFVTYQAEGRNCGYI